MKAWLAEIHDVHARRVSTRKIDIAVEVGMIDTWTARPATDSQ